MDMRQALHRLSAAGVVLQAIGDRLTVESKEELTEQQRAWIRAHKTELLQLLTDDDREAVREMVTERAAILEYDGGLDRQEAEQIAHGAAQDYYNHLMGVGKATGCCYAPRGRLCPEGQRLRDIYVQAVEAAPRGR